ncbi:hypothetical protein AG1IA_06111 [Rhizoctonia solani AG-1 IA]|uniref:Uncharacterized protein n=1 Tax=Thanatephorus cucumeris (strain AG1-IA) TaxID=983506 RepID=L8WU41_THACA|nr:hypothetical protein AG1IA_06111 [Rhizoctonia solani AG-1 IA]
MSRTTLAENACKLAPRCDRRSVAGRRWDLRIGIWNASLGSYASAYQNQQFDLHVK